MLILTRKVGERIRITTTDGYIWLTMCDGYIEVDDLSGLEPLKSDMDSNVILHYPDGDVEVVMFETYRTTLNKRIGIIAPDAFLILREELLTPEERL